MAARKEKASAGAGAGSGSGSGTGAAAGGKEAAEEGKGRPPPKKQERDFGVRRSASVGKMGDEVLITFGNDPLHHNFD